MFKGTKPAGFQQSRQSANLLCLFAVPGRDLRLQAGVSLDQALQHRFGTQRNRWER